MRKGALLANIKRSGKGKKGKAVRVLCSFSHAVLVSHGLTIYPKLMGLGTQEIFETLNTILTGGDDGNVMNTVDAIATIATARLHR